MHDVSHKSTDSFIRYAFHVVFMPVLFLAIFAAGAHAGAPPQGAVIIRADDQFNYAEERFARGDYNSAVPEYRRFVHFFPQDDRVETAMFRIGESFFNLREFGKAIPEFIAVSSRYTRTDPSVSQTAVRAYWMISECHKRQGESGAAIVNLRNLIMLTDSVSVQDEAWYRMGWIYLESADWQKAQSALERVSRGKREKYRLRELAEALNGVDKTAKKNPGLAGFLSVVPGLGQVYCNRYQDALIAFLVNGVLIAATVEAFDSGNEALGIAIGLVELGFYSGNIYGAVNGAHKYNRMQTGRFIEKLKMNLKIDLVRSRKGAEMSLAVRYPF